MTTNNEGNNGAPENTEKQPEVPTSTMAPVNAAPVEDNTPKEIPTDNSTSSSLTPTAGITPQIPAGNDGFLLKLDGVVKGEKRFPAGTTLEKAMKEFSSEGVHGFEFSETGSGKKVAKTTAVISSDMSLNVTQKAKGG